MLFFQVVLLAGYSYVLITTAWIGARKQAVLQIILLLLSALYLPFTLAGDFGSLATRNNPATLALRLPAECDRPADLRYFNDQPVTAKMVYTHRSSFSE